MSEKMLFNIPRNRTRLEQFKAKQQIETHHAPRCEMPWAALHLPTARKYGYGVHEKSGLMDCVAKVGRLLDESGVMGYGLTEADAIVATCKACNITVLPNDL